MQQKKSQVQEQQKKIQFNRRNLESEIKEFYETRGRLRLPFQAKSRISYSFAEKTAKFYLEEVFNRGLVKIVDTQRFDVTYEIEREIINDLTDEKTRLE